MTNISNSDVRRVRGSLAFLLSLVSPSLGFFYARRTRTAIIVAIFQVASVAAVCAWLIQAAYSQSPWIPHFPSIGVDLESTRDWIGLVLALPFALCAAIIAWRRPQVPRAGAERLLGYLAFLLLPFVIAVGGALYVRENVVQPFRERSAAMEPTLGVGDYFLAVPLRGQDVRAGDVVVYRREEQEFVGRAVAIPGQRIEFNRGVLMVDGHPVERTQLGTEDRDGRVVTRYRETIGAHTFETEYFDITDGQLRDYAEDVITPGHVFVVGDARDNSANSRIHGAILMSDIRRRVVRIIWSPIPGRVGTAVE